MPGLTGTSTRLPTSLSRGVGASFPQPFLPSLQVTSGLIEEVQQLESSITALKQKLSEAK